MFKKHEKKLRHILNRTKHALKILYRLLGILLFVAGNSILGQRGKYQILTRLIEEQFTSLDVSIKVQNVSEFPLYTRFHITIDSISEKVIDWKFFTLELIYQLGCQISDVSIEKDPENKNDNHQYMIDITKTAIGNLEKGLTSTQPMLFEPENTISVIKKAVELIKTGRDISKKTLANELNISDYRAEKLHEQIKQIGLLEKKSGSMTVN